MSKIIYRDHRGSLEESKKTIKRFNSLIDMIYYIAQKNRINPCDINFSLYFLERDVRLGWNVTYIVWEQNGVIGFFTVV